jgi:glycosyltransferase involved in cell wall biosynthesis
MAEISVILITYNRRELLSRMIKAVKEQTFLDYELILIDNGSTDGTNYLCEEYARSDSRVKLVHIENNNGSAPARNLGLKYITAKYILMIDDDDYCVPEMFEHLYHLVTKYQADIAITGCVDEYDDQIQPKYVFDGTYVYYGYDGLSEFLKREKFHTAPATKLFKSTLFHGKQWTEGTYVDDIHFIYKLFTDARTVVVDGRPDYYFRKHSGNVSGFLSGDILKSVILNDYLQMQDERVVYISENAPDVADQVIYSRASYMISMIEKIETGFADGCEKQLIYMKKFLKEHSNDLLNQVWTTDREKNLMIKYIL